MRLLKFRGQYTSPIDNIKRWLYFSLEEYPEIYSEYGYLANISQFTGLVDKQKVEIYEGDIVGYQPNLRMTYYSVKFGEHMTSADYYASLAYGFYLSSDTEEERELAFNSSYVNPVIEVVGNIYENPELCGRI